MEVKEVNSAMLSNYEVHKLLLDLKEELKQDGGQSSTETGGLSTIVYETSKYLENTPCAVQNPEIIENFLRSVAPFRLTKGEKLQILNLRPITPVEIQLMVEECEERLSEETVNELLEMIARVLPEKTGGTATLASGSVESGERSEEK